MLAYQKAFFWWFDQQDWGCFFATADGGFKHEWIISHFIYGMSSFPLTNSIIFQDC